MEELKKLSLSDRGFNSTLGGMKDLRKFISAYQLIDHHTIVLAPPTLCRACELSIKRDQLIK